MFHYDLTEYQKNALASRGIYEDYQDAMFPQRNQLLFGPHPPASMFGVSLETKTKTKRKTPKKRKSSKFGAQGRKRNTTSKQKIKRVKAKTLKKKKKKKV